MAAMSSDSEGDVAAWQSMVTKALDDDEPVCEQCGIAIPAGNRSKHPLLGMRSLDKTCFNAIRCLQTILKKPQNVELAKKMARVQKHEPLKYASIVATLAVSGTRGLTQRLECQAFMTTMVEEESDIRDDKSLLMTKPLFVSWHMTNMRMSEEQAVGKWERDKLDGDVFQERNKRGKLVIEVEMPTELVRRSATTSRREVQTPQPTGTDAKQFLKRRVPDDWVAPRPNSVQALGSLQSESEDDGHGPPKKKLNSVKSEVPSTRHYSPKVSAKRAPELSSSAVASLVPRRAPAHARESDADDDEEKDLFGTDDDAKSQKSSVSTSVVNKDDHGDAILPHYSKALSPAQFYVWKKQFASAILCLLGPYTSAT